MNTPYLTAKQVFALNEKHGWFQFGDAQSDVSKTFAQDAIVLHEKIRAAAPELLKVLTDLRDAIEAGKEPALADANRAIRKAGGAV